MTGNWTAIVINYNGAGFIEACLHALESSRLRPAEIVVVDNNSTDDSLLELHGYPRATVLAQQQNLGFAAGANVGLDAVETDIAVILNPDVEVSPAFGEVAVAAFDADPRIGAAGALLLYPDEQTIQHAGGRVERPLMTTSHRLYGEPLEGARLHASDAEFVTGGAMVLRMDAVRQVGGFDEMLSPVYYEDVDLCLRLRTAGWGVRFLPDLQAIHHEGVTLERQPAYYHFLHRNRIQFARKHLTDREWAAEFVPAEIERLRAEVLHLQQDDWLTISGANAIESLLRAPHVWDSSRLLEGSTMEHLSVAIGEARDHWEVTGPGKTPGNPLVRLVGGFVNRFGPRQYVDAALTEQRAFNASVVRALESQNRVLREMQATSLLLALDVIGHRKQETSTGTIRHPEM